MKEEQAIEKVTVKSGEKNFRIKKKTLSKREKEVLGLVAEGHTYKKISLTLNIGTETVRTHVKRLCRKLAVVNRTGAIARYYTSNESI